MIKKILLSLILIGAYTLISSKSYAQCGSADFSLSKTNGCAPVGVTFTANNFPANAKFEWNLGGGFVSGTDTAFRYFVNPGLHTVQLRITEQGKTVPCTTITKTDAIEVFANPDIKIVATDTLLCTGAKTITIYDSTKNVKTREWLFDGQAVAGNPQSFSKFISLGTHSLNLKVVNTDNCESVYKNQTFAAAYNNENVAFCGSVTQNSDDFKGAFFPNPEYKFGKKVTGYTWDFDGTSSNLKNPTNINFPSIDSIYDVTMNVHFEGGCVYSDSKANYVRKFLQPSIGSDTICNREIAWIKNLATGDGRSSLGINFPGGELIKGSISDSAAIQYTTVGNKTINYSFKYGSNDKDCQHNMSVPNIVHVVGPQARINSLDRIKCLEDTVELFSTSILPSGGNNIYTWKVYDSDSKLLSSTPVGPSQSASSIKLYFPKQDLFDVQLFVENTANGCIDSVLNEDYVRVKKPEARVVSGDTITCVDNSILFQDASIPAPTSASPYTYEWLVQHLDSTYIRFTATTKDFRRNIKIPGWYRTVHIVSSSPTCADTFINDSFMVARGMLADIQSTNIQGCEGHKVDFNANINFNYPIDPTNNITYLWSVAPNEDVIISDTASDEATFTFNKASCYEVLLEMHNSVGCRKAIRKNSICIGNKANFGWDPDTLSELCLGEPIKLFDSSSVNPLFYKWRISPSSAGYFLPHDSTNDISIVFNKAGSLDVTLIVKGPAPSSCVDSITRTMVITAPEAKFSVDKTLALCAPEGILFTNQTTNTSSLTYYEWDYGDGTKSNIQSASHTYVYTTNSIPGFEPKLIVYKSENSSCTDTFELASKIKIIGPTPNFSMDKNKECDSLTVDFTNLTTPINAEYYFDYGDATLPDTNLVKKHFYSYAANQTSDSIVFFPTLVASSFGCEAFYKDTIVIYRTPSADFVVNDSIGCMPLAVEFRDSSDFYDLNAWDLDGDGIYDTLNTDTAYYTYPIDSAYTITYRAESVGGCKDSITKTGYIQSLLTPKANLTLSTYRGCDSITVNFNSTNIADSFIIDYGNGVVDTNKFSAITYFYDPNATTDDSLRYAISMAVFNPKLGMCSDTIVDTVAVYRQPIANFVVDTTYGCLPLSVTFSDSSTDYSLNYWDIDGDMTFDTTNIDTFVYTYSADNYYNINYVIASAGGCYDTLSVDSLINVNYVPVADLTLDEHNGCDSLLVSFTHNNAADSFVIDYGNGIIDTNQLRNITYKYNDQLAQADSTTYTIMFTAYNNNLSVCADTIYDTVIIYNNSGIGYTIDTNKGCAPLSINFIDTSLRSVNAFWDFNGDGQYNDTGLVATNTYAVGTFNPVLITETTHGCLDTLDLNYTIEAYQEPIVSFSISSDSICNGAAVQFIDNSKLDTNLSERFWDFGKIVGADTAKVREPVVPYYIDGKYIISLRVIDSTFCEATAIDSIYIVNSAPPLATNTAASSVQKNSPVVYWDASPDGDAAYYNIYRYFNTGDTSFITRVNVGTNQFSDNVTITNSLTDAYYYLVEVIDTCGNVSPLNTQATTYPKLSATRVGRSGAELTWRYPTGDFTNTSFTLFRSIGDTNSFIPIQTGNASENKTSDSVVTCDSNLYYKIAVINSKGKMMFTNIDSIEVESTTSEEAVELLSVNRINADKIELKWTVGTQIDLYAYLIDRKDLAGKWNLLYDSTKLNSYVDTLVDANNEIYQYRIRSIDYCGNEAQLSNMGNNIILNKQLTETGIELNWNSYNGWSDSLYYLVEINDGTGFKEQSKVASTNYIDATVYGDTLNRCYRITAINEKEPTQQSISNIVCGSENGLVYVPNAFSPNGDGYNDTWAISTGSLFNISDDQIIDFQLNVYDRWGAIVFSTKEANKAWDGKKNGVALPLGSYIFTLKATAINGEKYDIDGSILIIDSNNK